MAESADVYCATCGEALTELPGLPVEERVPCPVCGSTNRRFTKSLSETVSVRAFLDGKKKSPGYPSRRRIRVHLQVGDQVEHRTGRWVFKQRRIDKDASPAWYFERITDPATGEVLHECSEPLEQHMGHGSAKLKVERKQDQQTEEKEER